MRRVTGVLVLAGCMLAPMLARADDPRSIYTCRDRNGRTITSDRPIPECADRAVRELGPSGIVKREIAAPLTPEQQQQKDAEDRQRKIADEAAREKRRRDSALLAAYSNENQIEQARRRSLADNEESIKFSQARLLELGKEKNALTVEVEMQKGKPVPPLLRRRVDDNHAAILDEESAQKALRSEIDRVNARYDDELRRYRELSSGSKGASR